MNSIDKPNTPYATEDHTLYILRDSLGKADAFITAAEDLIEQTEQTEGGGEGETEQTESGGDGDGDDVDDNRSRRRNLIEHLVESAKRAVRRRLPLPPSSIRIGWERERMLPSCPLDRARRRAQCRARAAR